MQATSFSTPQTWSDVRLQHSQPQLGTILAAAEAITVGEGRRASALLEGLLDPSFAHQEPLQRVTYLFAASLMARLQGDASETGNLYQDAVDPDAMLTAFQTLVQATPFIQFGYAAANTALYNAVAQAPAIHIIDIGIGAGTQWLPFLQHLAIRPVPPALIRITGIDVPTAGSDPAVRLRAVGHMLQQQARALGLPFTFESIAAPVELVDFSAIRRATGEVLVINAAFALHHVSAGDGVTTRAQSRDGLLERLWTLQPEIVTLVEPDVEHNALPFPLRIRESYVHYLAVFEALAAHLPPDLRERITIEHAFFGREIRNVVVGERERRVERHERHGAWRQRMQAQGFRAISLSRYTRQIAALLNVKYPGRVYGEDDMLILEWQGSSLVAASAWKPVPQTAPQNAADTAVHTA